MKTHLFKTIETVVCEHFGTTPQAIAKRNRLTPLRKSRQYVYYFCKSMFNECGNKDNEMSLSWIAANYGQDHATVSHAFKTVNNDAETCQSDRETLIILTDKINYALKNEMRESHPLPVEQFGK